ncbi:MAG TPA: hypothetical protein PKO06_06015 [Candidatus Ozemobacteraceae bacterium]|nr:hypothetical protein [Candidatus Ozemobacteraceae bacterium]
MEERLCRICGHVGEYRQRFCRGCGSELIDEDLPLEQTLVLDFPEQGVVEQSTSGCARVFYALVGIFILFPLLFEVVEVFGGGRQRRSEDARRRACYANMRVILGAVEMYNMDHHMMRDSVADSDVCSPEGLLVRESYLKSPITKPELDCSYSGYGLTKDGKIKCQRHGSVE